MCLFYGICDERVPFFVSLKKGGKFSAHRERFAFFSEKQGGFMETGNYLGTEKMGNFL